MAEVAAHLVDRVLPRASYRLWTLSVPFAYRLPIAADPSVLSDVLRRFIQEMFTYKRRQARRHGIADPTPAAVTFCQRFGSILNLHPHFHVVVPDGVFSPDASGGARWVPLAGPSGTDIEHLATRVAIRLGRYFDQDWAVTAATPNPMWPRSARLSSDPGCRPGGRRSHRRATMTARTSKGFPFTSANQWRPTIETAWRPIDAPKAHLIGGPLVGERMIRYGARPAFAKSRLSITPTGKVSYRLRRPWYTGQTHVTWIRSRSCVASPR